MISMPLLVFFGVSSLSSDQVYVHSASHEPKISPRFAITMRLKTDTTAMWATEATYNNNRLFMVPHLVSAQSAYRDIKICSFHHTHTHTHTHTHRCMRTHTQTHARTHAQATHTQTHMHTHARTHTHYKSRNSSDSVTWEWHKYAQPRQQQQPHEVKKTCVSKDLTNNLAASTHLNYCNEKRTLQPFFKQILLSIQERELELKLKNFLLQGL